MHVAIINKEKKGYKLESVGEVSRVDTWEGPKETEALGESDTILFQLKIVDKRKIQLGENRDYKKGEI